MNKDSLKFELLNGQSLEVFTALFIWAFIGFILSVLVEIIRHKSKIKRTGQFSLGYYLKDNLVRLLASIIIIGIGIILNPLEIDGIKGSVLMGFVTDKTIEALIKVKDNIDLSKILVIFTKKQ